MKEKVSFEAKSTTMVAKHNHCRFQTSSIPDIRKWINPLILNIFKKTAIEVVQQGILDALLICLVNKTARSDRFKIPWLRESKGVLL